METAMVACSGINRMTATQVVAMSGCIRMAALVGGEEDEGDGSWKWALD